MRSRHARSPFALVLCATAAPAVAQGFFTGTGNLGDVVLPSDLADVSANGRVGVGTSWVTGNYPYEAFKWTQGEGIASISPGTLSDSAGGISGLGAIIAGGFPGNGTRHAFRWTSETGAVSIGDLDGGRFRSNAEDVSARGDIFVGSGSSDNSDGEAFRWTAETGMVGLGDLPGGAFGSGAMAISADGLVIVGFSVSSDTGIEAFRWTEQTGMVGLGELQGGSVSATATAVSADGGVVVGSSFDADGERAFRWTEQTGMVALPKIHPDQSHQRAYGTSWDGSVIIGELGVYGVNISGAFYWTAEGGLRLLSDVLAEHGVTVPEGWHLDNALSVSADGRTIVGYGFNDDPVVHTEGFVAYLGPACRADYDDDGVVNTADVIAYLGAWSQRSIFADWNYDGSIDTRDVIGFLGEWVAKPGC